MHLSYIHIKPITGIPDIGVQLQELFVRSDSPLGRGEPCTLTLLMLLGDEVDCAATAKGLEGTEPVRPGNAGGCACRDF